jgi:hypothetical protein
MINRTDSRRGLGGLGRGTSGHNFALPLSGEEPRMSFIGFGVPSVGELMEMLVYLFVLAGVFIAVRVIYHKTRDRVGSATRMFRFRIQGADKRTRAESTWEIRAASADEARAAADASGYIVNIVEPVGD